MNDTNDLDLIIISAGFEHGGNVTLRHLDGHDELYVYPFESQLGNRHTYDYLSSLERFQYRYPEFPTGLSARELYELFFDEELKTLLRKPMGSKFKDANIDMSEEDRIAIFERYLQNKPYSRANIVAAFFVSTFASWKNYKLSGQNKIYVGYSPIIGLDTHKILYDFPKAHVFHVVRNPWSAYSDTKKRPFPLTFKQYITSWCIYNSIALMQEKACPERMKVIRYEDVVGKTEETMRDICKRVNIQFSEKMLTTSFNGKDISENIKPWGTINRATADENIRTARELSQKEIKEILINTEHLLGLFGYEKMVSEISNSLEYA